MSITKLSTELGAAEGGIILALLLLIISCAVFAVKFGLDIALNRKLNQSISDKDFQTTQKSENRTFYAIKNEKTINNPPRKRSQPKNHEQYTIIPEDKLFILKSRDKF